MPLLVFFADFVMYAAAARFLLFPSQFSFVVGDGQTLMLAVALGLAFAGLKSLIWRIWEAVTVDRGHYPLTWDEWAGGYLDFTAPERMLARKGKAILLFGCEFIASVVLLWLLVSPHPQMVARIRQLPLEKQSAAALFLSVLLGFIFARAGTLLRRIWERYVFGD